MVSQTVLSDNIAGLVSGTLTPAAFEAATSTAALQDAVQAAVLPGAVAAPQSNKKAVAIGVGVGE